MTGRSEQLYVAQSQKKYLNYTLIIFELLITGCLHIYRIYIFISASAGRILVILVSMKDTT